MIRPCQPDEIETCLAVINDGAQAYRGIIPEDCWHEPYMSLEYLQGEIGKKVVFWVHEENGEIGGVMGIQEVHDVTLIRHAYVKTALRRQGTGGKLLSFLLQQTHRPTLVGTWAAAEWAIRFYEKQGFKLVTPEEKNKLLKKYWTISERQIETSVVLSCPVKGYI